VKLQKGDYYMPMYDFQCKTCGYVFESFVKYEELTTYQTNTKCPECKCQTIQVLPCAPAIGDPVRLGVKKPPSDFQKYVLGKVKEKNPYSTIGERHSIIREV
jgi:putative FmdB family regulatory protein